MLALGVWGSVAGLAVALGPVLGGAIVEGISWHWIFWVERARRSRASSRLPRASSTRATAARSHST